MRRFLVIALALAWAGRPALADTLTAFSGSPGAACRQAIATAAQAHSIPGPLLAAIGRVESGRRDPQTGTWLPWPWTVDADGQGSFYDTKAQAIAAVRELQASGARSIDVGCMQVSLLHHPDAFANLDQAFDPVANAEYAAGFLRRLYAQTNDWAEAAAQYHSATPALAADYKRKVLAAWGQPDTGSALAAAWGATLSVGSPFGTIRPGMLTMPRFGTAGGMMPGGQPGGRPAPAGRSLSSYRATPIAIVGRLPGHG
jgi:hypothetical protein